MMQNEAMELILRAFKESYREYASTAKSSFVKRKRLRFEILDSLQEIIRVYKTHENRKKQHRRPDKVSEDDTQWVFQQIELFVKAEFGPDAGRKHNVEKIAKAAAVFEETGIELKNDYHTS